MTGETEIVVSVIVALGVAAGAGLGAAKAYLSTLERRLGRMEPKIEEARDIGGVLLRREAAEDVEFRADLARHNPKLYDRFVKPYLDAEPDGKDARR